MMLRRMLRTGGLRAGGLLALALLEGPGGGVELEEGDAREELHKAIEVEHTAGGLRPQLGDLCLPYHEVVVAGAARVALPLLRPEAHTPKQIRVLPLASITCEGASLLRT
eukprot:1196264-Prorocentrum_minimum.AAC.1